MLFVCLCEYRIRVPIAHNRLDSVRLWYPLLGYVVRLSDVRKGRTQGRESGGNTCPVSNKDLKAVSPNITIFTPFTCNWNLDDYDHCSY